MITDNNKNHDITDVASFLVKIKEFEGKLESKNEFLVFRGESQVYTTPCKANIFRKGVLDKNKHFERNLFDAMRQENLTNSEDYLHNAIDAQHGEFPSRLLDVSYNCLMALYFAVTPYYHKREDSKDSVDGMMYVFKFDTVYSPYAQNTNEAYLSLIKKDNNWLTDNILFSKHHKFIDNAKINDRIIAQQGAFVLFQGNDDSEISRSCYWGFTIPAKAKSRIRKELEMYFGIHTGSVYPEITNLEKTVCERSLRINNEPFTVENEISSIFRLMKKECKYFINQLELVNDIESEEFYRILRLFEKEINSYRIGIIELEGCLSDDDSKSRKEILTNLVNDYNSIVKCCIEELCDIYSCDLISESLLLRLD